MIKRLLALIPSLADRLDLAAEADRQTCLSAVDFIRSYADKYHHAKEEDILYPWIDRELSPAQIMWLGMQFQQVQEANRDLVARQKLFVEKLEAALTV